MADIGSDIWMAVIHYYKGDIWWMSLTFAFVAAPSVVGFIIICSKIGTIMTTKEEPTYFFFSLPGGMIYW